MRSAVFVALLGVSLIACEGGVPSQQGGDDGETPDAAQGSGSGSGSGSDTPTPAIAASVDMTAISTQLATATKIKVTVTGSGNFAGNVTLAATAVDGTGTAISDWTVALDSSTLTLSENGTASAMATLTIPSSSTTLTGNVSIAVTSSAGNPTLTSPVTVANQVSLTVSDGGNGQCAYPTGTTTIHVGTTVNFVNKTTGTMVIHSDNPGSGIYHEGQGSAPAATTAVNDSYTVTALTTATPFGWYCHSPGPDNQGNNPKIEIL